MMTKRAKQNNTKWWNRWGVKMTNVKVLENGKLEVVKAGNSELYETFKKQKELFADSEFTDIEIIGEMAWDNEMTHRMMLSDFEKNAIQEVYDSGYIEEVAKIFIIAYKDMVMQIEEVYERITHGVSTIIDDTIESL